MECGECTLCCTLFEVKEFNKPRNVHCQHCILNKGCSIHETKPRVCKDFDCAYAQMKNVDISLRPDKCGVVFERINDKIFLGTVDPEREIDINVVRGQIRAFMNDGFSVLLSSPSESKNRFFVLPNHDEEELKEELREILRERAWRHTAQI